MVFVTDNIDNDHNCWQSSNFFMRETATTREQVQTEKECSLYFNLLGNCHQSSYFKEKGLLIEKTEEPIRDSRNLDAQEGETMQNESDSVHMEPHYNQVALLRDDHAHYLYTVFQEKQKLRPSFTSLDSSHTWMIYWCLHGLDLLGQWPPPCDQHPLLSQRIISTLQSCWTTCTVSLPKCVVETDPILSFHSKDSLDSLKAATKNGASIDFAQAGGFGGGPDQLPHAATTYAAVMSLCIIASSSYKNDPENVALQYLRSIRAPMYIWLCTLYNPSNGSFRMHVDGEMDVRATYCVLAVIHLLQMVPSCSSSSCFFTQPLIAEYLSSCQSVWEGGYGGEPGAEAHGGYTYCAVASLHLFHGPSSPPLGLLDSMESCARWLVQRQMSYEGGFSGRINKLVDGCYSFWQGSAAIIVREHLCGGQRKEKSSSACGQVDLWGSKISISSEHRHGSSSNCMDCLFDADMLERYILLCSQDENGGLRDKPSKGRDFYHSCYCLSGLSIAQHFSHDLRFQSNFQSDVFHNEHTFLHPTHPCFNIRVEHVEYCRANFLTVNFSL